MGKGSIKRKANKKKGSKDSVRVERNSPSSTGTSTAIRLKRLNRVNSSRGPRTMDGSSVWALLEIYDFRSIVISNAGPKHTVRRPVPFIPFTE